MGWRDHLAQAGSFAEEPTLRNRLAIALAAAGDSRAAEALFREPTEQYPDYASPRRNLALLLERTRRRKESGSER